MENQHTRRITRFEAVLGIAVLGIVALSLPQLAPWMNEAKAVSSRSDAAGIAQAVLDFHTETGIWPGIPGQQLNLADLTNVPAPHTTAGSMLPSNTQPWLDGVPVDSWGRPFVAVVIDRSPASERISSASSDAFEQLIGRAHNTVVPPPGVAIVVISAGADGEMQTSPHQIVEAAVPAFSGDDVGFLLWDGER